MDSAIKVRHLTKKYLLGQTHTDLLSEKFTYGLHGIYRRLTSKNRKSEDSANLQTNREIYALKDVNFEVQQGDVIGVIGRNGAGKSTLLKILSRVTTPTSGEVEIYGRIASLLEVGTGFHPELTGRENIYFNSAILGMSKAQIKKKFDEIVDFAEIEQFIDTPVKRYSSGMYVRLAFAVAAHQDPEILLVDEVLSVGDAQFQNKCLGKMEEVGKTGRTVLLVSHNLGVIQNLCHKTYLFDKGNLIYAGRTNEVIEQYVLSFNSYNKKQCYDRSIFSENKNLRISNFKIFVGENESTTAQCGRPMDFEITYQSIEHLKYIVVHIVIDTPLGEHVLCLGTDFTGTTFERPPSQGKVICKLLKCSLMPGVYITSVYLKANGSDILSDALLDAFKFDVIDGDYFGSGKLPPKTYGKVLVPHNWCIKE